MRRVIDEWLAPFRRPSTLIFWISASLVAALVGPFGTYGLLDLHHRLVIWGGTLGAALVLGTGARAAIRRVPGMGQGRWDALAVALVLALFVTPFCARLVWAMTGAAVPSHTLAEIAATAFFSTLAVCALSRSRNLSAATAAGPRSFDPPPAHPPSPDLPSHDPAPEVLAEAPSEPRLLRRLDPALRGRLVSISVRDHYVDVVTRTGRTSLLMRLSDAMAEAEGEEGARIHRSHWVARHAARSLERNGARLVLLLDDGTSLPVSRAQRALIDSWDLPETAASNTTA